MKKIIDKIGPEKEIVFHKAFDHIQNKDKAMQSLINLGFTRVMTSGGDGPVIDYMKELKNLVKKFGENIEVMPGGGVNIDNIDILK